MRCLLLAVLLSPTVWAADFDLPASPSTVVWGYYSAQAKPVLTVHSGDTVRIHSVSACSLDRMEAGGMPNSGLGSISHCIHSSAAWGWPALFEAGDGHAGQGDGEVDITALEAWLTGTFRFVVHKDQHLLWPRAETPSDYIFMGFDEDLRTATEMAVRNMMDFLVTKKHLTRDDAYAVTSVAVDVDITQLVDGKAGVHTLCPKSIFH